jgi:transposase
MKRLQAFKYELQPNGEQACAMRCFTGSCRFVFNKALALHKTTATISQNHAIVCIEDLQIQNMSKSAAGIHRSDSGADQCRV